MKLNIKFINQFYNFILKNKVPAFILTTLFIFLLVTRFLNFSDYVMFIGDQGRDALIMYKLITFENIPFIGAPSSIGQVYLGPFYYYLVAPFLLLFNLNPVGPAFAVAIISIISTLIFTYFITKNFGKLSGIFFLILITISYTLIEFARFSWNPNLLPYFSFASMIFFAIWQKTKKIKYAILFGLSMGFSFQLHYLIVLIFPALGIFFLFNLKNTNTFKMRLATFKQLAISTASFTLTLTPLIAFEFKNGFLNFNQLVSLIFNGDLVEKSNLSYFDKFTQTSVSLLNFSLGVELSGFLANIFLVILVFLAFLISKKLKSSLLQLNALVFVFYIVFFSFISSPRIPHYFVPIYLNFFLIIATIIKFFSPFISFILVITSSILLLFLQFPKYFFIAPNNNPQIKIANEMANSFLPYIKNEPIQIVSIPFTESHGHFRYFLEIEGIDLLPENSIEQAKELYVMCFEDCIPQSDPQWQIAAFKNKKVIDNWRVNNVTIYKIISEN